MTKATITNTGIITAIDAVAAVDNVEFLVAEEAACNVVGSNDGIEDSEGIKVDGMKEGMNVDKVGDGVNTVGLDVGILDGFEEGCEDGLADG